jgi:hypothetical protein
MTDLKSVSHQELLKSARELVRSEPGAASRVAEHLTEIERRKLHVELGFQNVLEFFRHELGAAAGASRGRPRRAARSSISGAARPKRPQEARRPSNIFNVALSAK